MDPNDDHRIDPYFSDTLEEKQKGSPRPSVAGLIASSRLHASWQSVTLVIATVGSVD